MPPAPANSSVGVDARAVAGMNTGVSAPGTDIDIPGPRECLAVSAAVMAVAAEAEGCWRENVRSAFIIPAGGEMEFDAVGTGGSVADFSLDTDMPVKAVQISSTGGAGSLHGTVKSGLSQRL
ncbi:hypothetical protein I7I51_08355 [Histoplasma capsulatum]|uniref:Uncharacterized protein n=1 Tax=Ajellomyces capsulatus TaxID=5037 RepID=A0A8A1M056_AJECA|nr:hypothetical protein I7I51_08355 [Histoplasma capsulatum]